MSVMQPKGKQVHALISLRNRRRETPCGLYYYTDWPRSWCYRATTNWDKVTCRSCLRSRMDSGSL